MFEQTFKNIDDILRKDAGCSSEGKFANSGFTTSTRLSVDSILPPLLCYFLKTPAAKIFPVALGVQKLIVQKLDTQSAKAKRLEVIYLPKIAALDELKKSLLRRAFRAELDTRRGGLS